MLQTPFNAHSTDLLIMDIEGVFTFENYQPDERQTRYSPEAVACVTTFCGRMQMRMAIISREFLARGPNMFYRLEKCQIRDQWLHPDWLMTDPRGTPKGGYNKDRAAHAWLHVNGRTFRRFAVVDDNPGEFKNSTLPVFSPDPDRGLTYDLSVKIADSIGRRAEFESLFIPPRTRFFPHPMPLVPKGR